VGGYSLFVSGEQVDGEEPFAQLDLAIFEDRPNPNAELFPAFGALEPFVRSIQDITGIISAIGAFYYAIPTQSSKIINAFLLIREVINQFKKAIEIS
jgi:hypothetical protein